MKYIVAGLVMMLFGGALLSQGIRSGNWMTTYLGLGCFLMGALIVGLLIRWGMKMNERRPLH